MSLNHILIGSDPELIIYNKKTEKPVSSLPLLPGTKWSPYIISEEGHAIQKDNVLGEFNIPPTNNLKEFLSHINFVKDYIRKLVQEVNPDLDILCSAGEVFDDDQLQEPEAFEIGCEPDFNAWKNGKRNPRPSSFTNGYRSVGFHIHVSYSGVDKLKNIELIKLMDLFIGVPSTLYDKDINRRKLYGSAGSFRHCRYGVEYRTLSGKLLESDKTIQWVWEQTFTAIEAFNNGLDISQFKDDIIDAINNNNIETANKLIKHFNIKTLE